LCGLPEDTLFLDALRITPQAGQEAELETLAASWDAEVIQWLSFADAYWQRDEAAFAAAGFDPNNAVLEIWWHYSLLQSRRMMPARRKFLATDCSADTD
jgi:hypothetical protein